MTATRRTPAQIAADDLAKTEAKLEAVEARIQRLRDDLDNAERRRLRLAQLRDYQAAHPLLATPEAVEPEEDA